MFEPLRSDVRCIPQANATFTKGHSRKGAALYRLARYPEAVAAYEKALELDASNADTRQALAEARKAVDDMRRRPSVEELKGKAADFLAKNRQAALLALPRLFLVINALLYILPLSAAFSMGCYRRAVMGAMATYATLLFQKHGRPHFSMQYLARLVPDPAMQYLFLSLLLFPRPNALGLGAILLVEGLQALWFVTAVLDLYSPHLCRRISGQMTRLGCMFTQDPRYGTLSPQRKWQVLFERAPVLAVNLEIYAAAMLVLELVTPRRNLMGLFLFGQYLQLRYMLDQNGVVKNAFKQLDTRILGLVNHPRCPPAVGKGYNFVRDYLHKAAQLPDPNQPQAARPRCTVM